MTIALERDVEWAAPRERRGQAREPRRSWASAQPFELRPTPFNGELARAQRWTQVVVSYQRRVIALDALAVLVVGVPFLTFLYGVEAKTLGLVGLALVGFLTLVGLARGYETKALGDGPSEFQAVMTAGLTGALVLMSVSYGLKAEISRALIFGGIPLLVLIAVVGRYVHRQVLHRRRAKGGAMMSTLVVGDRDAVGRVVDDLARATYHGFQVSGVCLPDIKGAETLRGAPVVGALADVPQVVADRALEVVVVAGSYLSGDGLRRLSWALDRAGVQLIVAPEILEVAGPRLSVRPTAGLSLLEVEVGSSRRRMIAKAVLDRMAGAALLLFSLPIVATAAVMIRATSPGPAFYRQTRVGVDGRLFTMWKLRSMYVDSDAHRESLLEQNEGAGVLFKMREDPRVTPVGRVLRRYSIDELPQLFNVVIGDMSMVGPRPPLATEVAAYEDAAHRRLRVKPGVTGLWQVSGRSDLSWEESVRLDLRYVDNWSVAMDLTILWKTLRAVLRGAGAY